MPTVTPAPLAPDIPSFLEPLGGPEPLTVAVMVSSVDGRASMDGRVGALTGPADQQVLLGARERAAAVLVGRGTVAAEGYDRLLDDEARGRRERRGLPPEPELVVVSRESPPLTALLADLRDRHPRGLITCEGGPTLLGRLVEQRRLDQLVLCLSPRIVGDDGQKRLLEHPDVLDVPLELLGLTIAESFLFLRYGVA